MAELLLRSLERANLAAAAAILFVVLMRAPARRMFGSEATYQLWRLPLIATGFALIPAPWPGLPPGAAAPLYEILGRALSGRLAALETALGISGRAGWLLVVWGLGALAMTAWLRTRQARFEAEVRAGVAGPAVAGLFWPRVVTPRDFRQRFTEEERRLIEVHERIHIERNDPWANLVIAACTAVFWMNPLVHLAAALARADQELACDAAVLWRLPSARRLYAETLLKAGLGTPAPLACAWLPAGAHPLVQRIGALRHADPKPGRRAAALIALFLMAGASVAAGWLSQPGYVTTGPHWRVGTGLPPAIAADISPRPRS